MAGEAPAYVGMAMKLVNPGDVQLQAKPRIQTSGGEGSAYRLKAMAMGCSLFNDILRGQHSVSHSLYVSKKHLALAF